MASNTGNGMKVEARDQGLGDLVRELSGQLSTLVRQEVELARTELSEKGKKAGIGAGLLGGAAIAALLTLGTLTALLILALDTAMAAWAAALIVMLIWAAVAAALALIGRSKLREVGKPMPEKTVETVKEDVQWLKSRT